MIRRVDDDCVPQLARLLQLRQQTANLPVDLRHRRVVADVAGANLLGGRVEATGQPLVAVPGVGVIGRNFGEVVISKAGGQGWVVAGRVVGGVGGD